MAFSEWYWNLSHSKSIWAPTPSQIGFSTGFCHAHQDILYTLIDCDSASDKVVVASNANQLNLNFVSQTCAQLYDTTIVLQTL